jgi:hypothetical protein
MSIVTILFPASSTATDALLCERTLAMIRKQTFTDWKLVVVESSPPPVHALYEVVKRSWPTDDQRLTWLYRPAVTSLPLALQFALALVEPETELLAFVSNEYIWSPRYLETMTETWRTRKSLGLIYCDEAEYEPSGTRVRWIPRVRYDRYMLFRFCQLHLPALVASYLRTMDGGGFVFLDEVCPDWDMALRLSQFGVKHLPEPLVVHHWTTHVYPDPIRQAQARQTIEFRLRLGLTGEEAMAELQNWKFLPQVGAE